MNGKELRLFLPDGIIFLIFFFLYLIKSFFLIFSANIYGFLLSIIIALLFYTVYRYLNLYRMKLIDDYFDKKVNYFRLKALICLLIGLDLILYILLNYGFITIFIIDFIVFIGWYLYYGLDSFEDNSTYDLSNLDEHIFEKLTIVNARLFDIKNSYTNIDSLKLRKEIEKVLMSYFRAVGKIKKDPTLYDKYLKLLTVYLDEFDKIISKYSSFDKSSAKKYEESLLNICDLIVKSFKKIEDSKDNQDEKRLDISILVLKDELKEDLNE